VGEGRLAEPEDVALAASRLLGNLDLAGRRVAQLVSGERGAAHYEIRWAGTNDGGGRVKAGLYFASMKSKPLSEDNTGIVYGAGVEYALSRELGLRGEWQRYNNVGGGSLGFNTDIDVISAAVVWRPH